MRSRSASCPNVPAVLQQTSRRIRLGLQTAADHHDSNPTRKFIERGAAARRKVLAKYHLERNVERLADVQVIAEFALTASQAGEFEPLGNGFHTGFMV